MTPGRHGDAVPCLRSRAASQGVDGAHHPDGHGARARPGGRWAAGHRTVVAVDLLRERPDRHRRVRLRVVVPARAPRADGRTVRPGRVRAQSAPAWRWCSTRCRKGRPRAGDRPRCSLTGVAGVVAFVALVRVELGQSAPDAGAAAVHATACSATRTWSRCCRTPASRRAVPHAAVPAGPPRRSRPLESGLTTFPQAIGVMVFVPDRRPALPSGGTTTADGVRARRGGHHGGRVHADRPDVQPVVDPRPHVRPRRVHGLLVHSPAGGHVRHHHPVDTGRATAIFSTQRQVAAALGVATSATVLVSATQLHLARIGGATGPAAVEARVSAYHDVFAVAAVIALGAAIVAWFVRDEDAAATMRARAVRRPRR